MIQSDQNRFAPPTDLDQGVQMFPDHPFTRIFHPSDAGFNSLSLWMQNADMTPVGMKGVWLADYCQQTLRNMNISQRMINKMSIKLVWVFGSASDDGEGFALGSHREDDFYNGHVIKICIGAESNGKKLWANKVQMIQTLTHELIHTAQVQSGRLNYAYFSNGESCRYTFKTTTGIKQVGWTRGSGKEITSYSERAHEFEAHSNQTSLMNQTARQVPDQDCLGFDAMTQQAKSSDEEQQWKEKWLSFRRGSFSGWI